MNQDHDRGRRPGPSRRVAVGAVLTASLIVLAGCSGIDTGFNPGPDVRKERGPLVVPPPGVLRGTAM